MADTVENLLIRFDANTESLRRELKRADTLVAGSSKRIDKSMSIVDTSFKRNAQQAKLMGAAIVGSTALAARAIIGYSDSYKNLRGQLMVVTDGQEELNRVWQGSLSIANETGASLNAAASLYQRLALATTDAGLSAERLLGITETLNKATVVSGASSQEAEAALIQLGQGLAEGALRGEELNSVLSQTPYVAGLIAKEMRVATGALRKLASEGKITTEIVISALENQAESVDEAFSQMPITVERATNRVKNLLADAFGRADTSGITDTIVELGDMLEDPKITQGLTDIADAVISLTTALVKAAAAIPEFTRSIGEGLAQMAGFAGGANSIDGLAREADEIISKLDFLRKQGQTSGGTWDGLIKDLTEVNKKLATMETLFGESEKTAKKLSKTTDDLSSEVVTAAKKTISSGKESLKISKAQVDSKEDLLKAIDSEISAVLEAERQREQRIYDVTKRIDEQAAALGRSAEMQAGFNALAAAGLTLEDERGTKLFRSATAAHRAAEAQSDLQRQAATTGLEWQAAAQNIARALDDLVDGSNGAFSEMGDHFANVLSDMSKAGASADLFSLQSVKDFGSALAQVGATWAANTLFDRETSGLGSAAGTAIGGVFGGPAGSAVGSFLGEGLESTLFGQDNDGNNAGGANFDLATRLIDSATWGSSGSQASANTAQQLAESLVEFSRLLGGSSLAGNITVGANDGIKYGNVSFGENREDFFQAAFDDVISGATALDDALKDLLLGFEGTSAEIADFSKVMLSIASGSVVDPVENAIGDFLDAQSSLTERYRPLADAVRDSLDAFDGSAEAAGRLNSAISASKQSAYEAATAILGLSDSISKMVGDQLDFFVKDLLTEEQLQASLEKDRREALSELKRGDIGADRVEELVKEFIDASNDLWRSFSDDQKKNRQGEFINATTAVETAAQSILGMSLSEIRDSESDINARIASEITNAGVTLQDAASDLGSHVGRFGQYVQQLATSGITINIQGNESELL